MVLGRPQTSILIRRKKQDNRKQAVFIAALFVALLWTLTEACSQVSTPTQSTSATHPETGKQLVQDRLLTVEALVVQKKGEKVFTSPGSKKGSLPPFENVREPTKPAAGKPRRLL